MQSCLGLYIEDKLIKYAKVSTEKDKTRIDNFGVEFYEDLPKAIAQIIEETGSEKVPISINLLGESYDYFKIFSLLTPKDMEKAIATEVETIYFEKGLNKATLENRHMLSPVQEENDRLRVFSISANKTQIMEESNIVGKGRLTNVVPLPVVLPELIKLKERENSIIVNIEEKAVFTSIIDGKIYEVQKINTGMSEIIEKISFKENSYSKAYEICKNTTIFTRDIVDIDNESNLYLEDIMPTLYNIVQEINAFIDKLPKKISRVYITGSAALINNIDLYFKEYVQGAECVILKPSFIDQNKIEINIKDYIEVNSAIAVAYSALTPKTYNINFLGKGKANKTSKKASSGGNILTKNITMPKIDLNIKGPIDSIEASLIRGLVAVFLIFAIYIAFSALLSNSINNKNKEISEVKQSVSKQINLANSDLDKLKSKTSGYQKMRTNLEEINQKIAENYRTKNAIPNLLYHIMNIMPNDIQITSIENTADKHIVINAESPRYEYLAYFTAGLRTGGFFSNVISGEAEKMYIFGKDKEGKTIIEKEYVKVTIEGDLQ